MQTNRIATDIIFGLLFILVILAAPLAGAVLAGQPAAAYLEFPPVTMRVEQPSFSWAAFIAVLLFVIIVTWPFWSRLARGSLRLRRSRHGEPYPWWGWVAAAGLILFWILAWSRFSWFEPFQRHTFFPLWFSLIIVLNAVACRLSDRSLLTHRTPYFLLLFPASALFWWIFEYLNRFLNNWYYTGISELSSQAYFWEATLAFSTVLPAVMSIRFILLQLDLFSNEYRDFPEMPWLTSSRVWTFTGVLSVIVLAGIGWRPEYTYPLVWIAPGLLWIAFQQWKGCDNPLLQDSAEGDLTLVWSSAAAALICGFFWEMWNYYSEARWIYNIPGVDRFRIFEMPLPGYAGYLPFGVLCAVVANSLLSMLHRHGRVIEEEVG